MPRSACTYTRAGSHGERWVRDEASGGWLSSVGESRLGRRSVLRAGAGVAAGLLVGGEQRSAGAVPIRQTGSSTLGGRWVEADGFRLAQRADPAQFIAFTADFPFYALAPSWSGEAIREDWSSCCGAPTASPGPNRSGLDRRRTAAGPTGMAALSVALSPRREPSFCNTGPTTAPATSR